MEESEKKDSGIKSSPQLAVAVRMFINEIFDIRHEVNFEATSESVKKDVEFKGFNIWILILSIFICSIGLNLNSTAVVIGAMLISPLMGPITGIGFAVGTFDRELLLKAIKNLGIALSISMLTSFLFFRIAPAGINQSELLARTNPGIMDLLVATFGGFAGILANSRNVKTNVIPGVAIATALMPPLCTAGFGLATGNLNYFFGAFYLFFINSVFISLAALVVIRYLRFPIMSYVDLATRRKVRWFIVVFVILVSVPSILLYQKALKKSVFEFRAKNFVDQVINSQERQADHINFFNNDSIRKINVWVYGLEISESEKDSFNRLLPQYKLSNTELVIRNMGNFEEYKRMFEVKDQEISKSSGEAEALRSELVVTHNQLDYYRNHLVVPAAFKIDRKQLNSEAHSLFNTADSVQYLFTTNSDTLSQIKPVFLVYWHGKTVEEAKMEDWLKVRFSKQFGQISVLHFRK
ncbi:MAG: TIGR00341 family protein [Bacteroidetes bacterium]|nr:TIGR00341 family protein [Bacteroidota bacterium]